MRLAGRVAVVTGAARGIGAAIARRFVAEGAWVALLDIDGAAASVTASLLGAWSHPCDIADRAQVEAAIAAAADRYGPADILVNNAGVNAFADPLALTDAAWARCMAIDVDGAWHCTRAVLPAMLAAGRGAIVNIASTHGFSIIPGCFPYPVAKHALIGLTRALGVEYAPHGIRINAVAPGYIETALLTAHWAGRDAERARIERLIPLRRTGTPDEVAAATLFLASDEAGFCAASVLTMDGGRSVVYHD